MPIGPTELVQLLPLILPFIGAFLVAILGKWVKERYRAILGTITAIFLFAGLIFIVFSFYTILALGVSTDTWLVDIWYWPPGAFNANNGATLLRVDMLAIFMATMFTFLGFFVTIYSIKYMEKDTGLSYYYALLLTLVGGMIGIVYSGDFFTLFVFWETMSVSSYALVAFRKEEAEPLEAGIKYLLLSAVGSTLILFTMSFLYGLTGSVNFDVIAAQLAIILSGTPSAATQGLVMFVIMGLVMGFGVKAAIAPLATWLPDAHPAAPSGISAMLSGVVIMNGGYAILRTLLVFFPVGGLVGTLQYHGYIISWFAIFTMIYGNLMALTQKDIKRLLAFSTIVNVGYIIFGFSIAMMPFSTPEASFFAITGSLFHMTTHMLAKGMLFLTAGIFLHAIHTRDLDKLRGIGRRMPVTMFCFTIGALSLAGVPPLIGFFSKFWIIWGSVLAGGYLAAVILVINSAFSVVYYIRLLQILAFSDPSPEVAKVKETHPLMLFSIVVLTIFIIGMGLFPHFFLTVANLAAQAALGIL